MHAIASREHDEDRDWQCGQILLVFHAFVGRQQHVELTRREREKFAILDAGPAPALNCHDRVTRQQRAEPSGYGLIKQDAHRQRVPSLRPPEPVSQVRG